VVSVHVFVPLPENDRGAVLALLHHAAALAGLAVGEPVGRGPGGRGKEKAIDTAVRFAAVEILRCAALPAMPRPMPGDNTGVELLDDAVGNHVVHGTVTTHCRAAVGVVGGRGNARGVGRRHGESLLVRGRPKWP